MRLSVVLLIVAALGVVGGAALIGLPAMGGAVIFDSLCLGAWALVRDDGSGAVPQVTSIPAHIEQVFDRSRGSA